jgi:hypothetical protein
MSGLQIAFAVTGISPAHQVLKCISKLYYTFGYKSIIDLPLRVISRWVIFVDLALNMSANMYPLAQIR